VFASDNFHLLLLLFCRLVEKVKDKTNRRAARASRSAASGTVEVVGHWFFAK
jgi:hypothetical protein